MSTFDINRKEPVLSPRKAELPLHFVPGSRLFLYDIFGWTSEQSPREQQLAVVIYNVCFLVLGESPRPQDVLGIFTIDPRTSRGYRLGQM
jgi:hypothetical protein